MKRKKDLFFVIGLAGVAIFLGVRIVSAQFSGPTDPAGVGGGALRYDSNTKTFGIGAAPLGDTTLLIQNEPGNPQSILLKSSGGVDMFDVTEGTPNSTTTVHGNLVVLGTISGNLAVAIDAGHVTPGVFNSLELGGGFYAFPAGLGINTNSAASFPADLFVNGTMQAGTSTFMGQILAGRGTSAVPGIANRDYPNTGIWFDASNPHDISLVTEGNEMLQVKRNGSIILPYSSSHLEIRPPGSEGAPAIQIGSTSNGGGIFAIPSGGLAFTTEVADSAKEQMRIASSTGNIGIGITTPAQKLEVNGAMLLTPTSTVPTALPGTIYFNAAGKFKCYETVATGWTDCVGSGSGGVSSGVAGQVAFYTTANTVGGNGGLIWDNGNSRLGIGGGSPSYNLHLNSPTNVTIGMGMQSAGRTWLSGIVGSTSYVSAPPGSYFIHDIASSTHRLVINPGGNIGIGVSQPTSIVDMNGALTVRQMVQPSLSFANQGKIYFDSTSKKFRVSENAGGYVDLIGGSSGITGSGTTNYIPRFTSSSVIGNSQIYDNGTNVGIGTGGPGAAKLDINGTIKITDGTQGPNKVLASDVNGLASWKTLASIGQSCNLVQTSGTNNFGLLSMIVGGRNICEDVEGCTYRVWRTAGSGGDIVASYAAYPMLFIQNTVSKAWVDAQGGNQTGTNGGGVETILTWNPNSNPGITLYDDLSGIGDTADTFGWHDRGSYDFNLAVCD